MKKIFITFMAAVSLLTFNRCTSLDMEPVSSISDANYWKSSDQFKAFNTGLHSLLRLRSYNIFVLGEPRADIYGDQPFDIRIIRSTLNLRASAILEISMRQSTN